MVSDPIPQCSDLVEAMVQHASPIAWRGRHYEKRKIFRDERRPEPGVVTSGEHRHPKHELQLRDYLARRWLTLSRDVKIPVRAIAQRWPREASFESSSRSVPSGSINFFNRAHDGVSKHDFTDMQRHHKRGGNLCIPSIQLEGARSVVPTRHDKPRHPRCRQR